MDDLGDIASTDAAAGLRAVDQFTDRQSELDVFSEALRQHHSWLVSEHSAHNGRRNVISFYGVGGVGKSTLSRRLEDWARGHDSAPTHWGEAPSHLSALTARIDLHQGGGNFDVVAGLIEVRSALASFKSSWPGFDLAMAAYWAATRPGEQLPVAKGRDGRFASATRDLLLELAGDLGAKNVVTGTGVGLVRIIVKGVQRSTRMRAAVRHFDTFETLLKVCSESPSPTEPRPEIAASLAAQLTYAIDDMDPAERPMLVVFVDTIERLRLDVRREGERLLNQLVFAMPYTLFVLTGRNALDWAEQSAISLFRAGPLVWPGLIPGAIEAKSQFLVGNLSPEDATDLLVRVRQAEQLPISDEVVDLVVSDSRGLPLYLDLAIEVTRSVKRNGGSMVTPEQVTGSLGALVLRLLDDMPQEEQQALHAACLLPFFDTALAAVGASVSHGAVQRLVRRPLIGANNSSRYPYRVHDEIRIALRSESGVAGSWVAADWLVAGHRALDHVKKQHEAAIASADQPAIIEAVVLALHVVAYAGVTADWVDTALITAPSFGALASRAPRVASSDVAQTYLDFIGAKANLDGPTKALETLERLADFDGPLSLIARRHFAYSLRNRGEHDRAIEHFEILSRLDEPDLHGYQRAMTMVYGRRFVDAAEAAASLPEDRRGWVENAIQRYHGELHPFLAGREVVRAQYATEQRFRELHDQTAVYLRMKSWVDRGILDDVHRELEVYEEVGNTVAEREALAALANLFAGDQERVLSITEELLAREGRSNDSTVSSCVSEPRALDAFVRSDAAAAEQVHSYLMTDLSRRTAAWIPTECLLDSMGFQLPELARPSQWVVPYELVRRRWVDLASAIRIAYEGGPQR